MSNPTFRAQAQIIVREDGGIDVRTVWSADGVQIDRPEGVGFGLGSRPGAAALARRLKAAIEAGAVFTVPVLRTDVNGRTYVSTGCTVIGRRLNADLRRLGY